MTAWLTQHRHAAWLALRRPWRTPTNTLLALFAIGVALALPVGGYLLFDNAAQLAGGAAVTPQITVFMKADADRAAADKLRARLTAHTNVRHVQFLPREETLQRMKSSSGLRDVIDALPGNPFPDAFVVTAKDASIEALEQLADEFRGWPRVDAVQLDSAWLHRLNALLAFGRNAVILLAILLAGGLVAMTFNIIRMQVLTHREEIVVSQLLGATDGFIRRPYLYYGALLGLGGGLAAWGLVSAAVWWLRSPLSQLLQMYEIQFALHGLTPPDTAVLLGGAAVLGWLGAWLSLAQHSRR